jgi:hypothetical protein
VSRRAGAGALILARSTTSLAAGYPLEQSFPLCCYARKSCRPVRRSIVGGLIYLIGLIVVILFILSFLGLR